MVAVDDVCFTIEEGEVFSLLGPNGAGKTTIISILSCLLRPDSGDARVGGYSVIRQPAAVRSLIGVVPQEIALYEDLTGEENLLFWGRMYGLSGKLLQRRAAEIIELTGLEERQKDRVGKYSGGMKRRLNIGVALLHQPQFLYLDEPTVGIDPQSRRAILEGIKALNKGGSTILYTTHYMEEAQELSTRVGIMDQGKMIAMGTQTELVKMVGGHTRMELAVDKAVPPLVARWRTLPGVSTVIEEGDNRFSLLVDDASVLIPRLFDTSRAAGARITEISLSEPNLEMVFLQLTGRALRD